MAKRKSGEMKNPKREGKGKNQTPNKQKKQKLNVPECKVKENWCSKLEDIYGMKFPDDFFQFYEYLEKLSNSPLSLQCLDLTGPYDYISENIKDKHNISDGNIHMHGRFYYDLPEMMTVIYDETLKDGFHISYFRDDPSDNPMFLVGNRGKENGELQYYGDNIFAAFYIYTKMTTKKCTDSSKRKILNEVCSDIEKESKKYGYSLEAISPSMKVRNKKINSKCFHKVGMVVPIGKMDIGYRELPKTDRELKQVMRKIVETDDENIKNEGLDEIQEIITLIQFANDECDYGMGYELGINLFTFGGEVFHGMIRHVLQMAYQLLKRDLFATILEKHLENRLKDKPLSVIPST